MRGCRYFLLIPPPPCSLLINAYSPDTIDPRALNHPKRKEGVAAGASASSTLQPLSLEEVEENLTLLLTSARSFGCTLGALGLQDLQRGGEVREMRRIGLPGLHSGEGRGF